MYDLNELRKRIATFRRAFLIIFCVLSLLMVGALVLIFLGINDTLTFSCIALEFVFLFLFYRLFCSYKPTVLFSREIRGENVMEDEYIGMRKINNFGGRYRGFGGKVRLYQTGANKKKLTSGSIRSKVYLRLDDGSVICISDLYKSNTDIYEEGDILIKYSGTKYPIVLSRSLERQPCPLCGEINGKSDAACRGCGLGIKE